MSSTRTIRLGIIGLGAMGAEMLAVASRHQDYVVAVAVDRDPAVVARFAGEYPAVTFGTDSAAVVGAPDVDAVYVATPPAAHGDLAIAALDVGQAVFCEKPLAIDLEVGRQMVRASRRSQAASAVNFALSDRNATLYVEDALRQGDAGDVLGVEVRLSFPCWPREFQANATWLAGRSQGGFVREVFSHFVYLTDRLLGPLRPVRIGIDYPTGQVGASETAAWGELRAGDVPVQLTATSGVTGPESYEWLLKGSKQSYLLRDWDQLLVSEGNTWVPVTMQGERGSEATRLSAFARAFRGEKAPDLADFEAALRVQKVIEAFHGASEAS